MLLVCVVILKGFNLAVCSRSCSVACCRYSRAIELFIRTHIHIYVDATACVAVVAVMQILVVCCIMGGRGQLVWVLFALKQLCARKCFHSLQLNGE